MPRRSRSDGLRAWPPGRRTGRCGQWHAPRRGCGRWPRGRAGASRHPWVPSSSSATAAMVRENALRSRAYHLFLRGAQRIDNLEAGGTHGGEEAANQGHGEGEGDGLGHDRRRERKAKREVGKSPTRPSSSASALGARKAGELSPTSAFLVSTMASKGARISV